MYKRKKISLLNYSATTSTFIHTITHDDITVIRFQCPEGAPWVPLACLMLFQKIEMLFFLKIGRNPS